LELAEALSIRIIDRRTMRAEPRRYTLEQAVETLAGHRLPV
jgi:hypothetical protein